MRILQLGKYYPPHRGGIETHLETLSRRLALEHEVNVIVASDSRRSRVEKLNGVNVSRLTTLATFAATPLCPQMAIAIRRTPADLVHLHVPNPYAALAFLLSGHRAPLVISWHSDVVRQRRLARLYAPITRRLVKRAEALIASSAEYKASSPILARNRRRVRVIPYGIDVDAFQASNPARVAQLRARYGPRITLAVGRLVYYKGFEHVIRAMRRVAGHLLIVGEGPLRQSLERLADTAEVAARVTFLGDLSREELVHAYHAADVFVLPSVARSEAFGIVQLEAMASGTPVVNTRIASGVPLVSIDGQTGITVEPQAPDALAAALTLLLDNLELRARCGAAGRQRVREHFGLDVMVERTLTLYREVVGARALAAQ
jgi:rhamnosyl/mannosyltransferase